jgi:outer membrane protein OmpA-like peptidoglycan-associated protein
MVAASPAPAPARERVNCPIVPIFFENGQQDISAAGRAVLATNYDWVLDNNREDVWIVLRTATLEPEAVVLSGISHARAEAVRIALVADGVPADHIIVAHGYRDGPNFAPEGWIGGWVQPEFYLSTAALARLFPPGSPPC